MQMNQNMVKAKEILFANTYTCVLVKENKILTSDKRGVAPLLDWIEEGRDFRGYAAADKVVGRGAAMLYVLMGVQELYAAVLSKEAEEALTQAGISVTCGTLVSRIQNRTKTGYCPMEEAVLGITDPKEAHLAIKRKLETLSRFYEPIGRFPAIEEDEEPYRLLGNEYPEA